MVNFRLFWCKKIKLHFACFVLLYLLTGCAAKPLDLSLTPTASMEIITADKPLPVSIGVMPFIDSRPVRHGSDNTKWKGLIPGVLWLEISSDIPETYSAFSHYESKPLDRATTVATVEILKRSRLFTEVVDLHKEPDARPDYLLKGEVYQTLVNETGYYYGSCIYAWLVRVLGLPYVSFNVEYHIGLTLLQADTGKQVWKTEIKGSREDKFYSVYSISNGRDGKHVIAWNISDIFAEEFNKQAVDLKDALTR